VLEVEPQIIRDFVRDGRVKIVYRHLVQIGEPSLVAGEASECAGEQGQLWEMREALYAAQNDVAGDARDVVARIADGLGLDDNAFAACMDDARYREAVQADHDAATAAGVRSRPVFDINGTTIIGSRPYEVFRAALEQ
jgi:protein-disulfide isomerase